VQNVTDDEQASSTSPQADRLFEIGDEAAAPATESGTDDAAPDTITVEAGPVPLTEDPSMEWFRASEELDEHPEPALPRRRHHVTAVIVGHDGAVWLPAVLTTLALQDRPPDDVVGVDTGSADETRALLVESLGTHAVTDAPARTGFGAAVAAGLAAHSPLLDPDDDTVEWLWLLHDDSAPDQQCLGRLLDTADNNPSVGVLGPKILGWHDRRLLLEAGVTVTGSGRRITGLDRREHDQGQHDGDRDVLAVSSAGMLVRRDVWERLEGFDPTLPLFRDDLDFCWRAHRAGERVMVATDAVLHHREASAHGRRADDLAPRPHRADREAAVHVLLAQSNVFLAPFVALRLLAGSLGRALVYLLGKDVAAARDEVAAVLALALHPSRIRSSRDLIRRTTTLPASVVRSLRPTIASQTRQVLEMVAGIATTSSSSSASASVSALDSGPVGDDADYLVDGSSGWLRRVITAPSVLLLTVLVLVAIAGTRGLWLGDGVLQGGTLLPAPPGAGDLWQTYLQAWHDVGPGSTTASPPYLALLATVAFVLLGKAPAAVSLVLLLGIPLAGLSAYITMRGLVPQPGIRAWAAAAYALLPAMTGAVAAGRLGTTILAIALPFALRSLVRISSPRGTFRRAAGAAILVAIVLSVAPAVWVLLVVAGIVAAAVLARRGDGRGRAVLGRLAIALLVPLVLLLPWSWHVLSHPSLLLLEPGLAGGATVDPDIAPWQVLLLHPGGPGMTPVWVTVGLLVAGLLALLRRDRLAITGPFALLGGLALLLGLLQTLVLVTPPGMATEVRPWPGQATVVMGLALIAMAAVAVHGLRDRFIGTSFTPAQPVALLVALAALLAPVLTAGWFAFGLPSALVKAPRSPLPAFVAADAVSAQAPRTLMIGTDAYGRVTYSLINGIGPQLGDAETGPPASAWSSIDPYVAEMVSGRGGDEVEALAGYGVRYVLLAPDSSPDLIPTLDGEPGLRRLSSAGGEVLWRVAGTTTRARVLEPGQQVPVGLAPEGTRTADPYLAQILPEGSGDRALVIGASQEAGWTAEAIDEAGARTPLTAATVAGLLDWSSAFVLPEGAPLVEVRYVGTSRSLAMWLQLLILLALVVMALPERRRDDPDPDTDVEAPAVDLTPSTAQESR
jgi:GT2 family glycosyltransferase